MPRPAPIALVFRPTETPYCLYCVGQAFPDVATFSAPDDVLEQWGEVYRWDIDTPDVVPCGGCGTHCNPTTPTPAETE